MDFLNWAADHYVLFTFMLIAAIGVAHGLGNMGNTNNHNHIAGED